VFLIAPLVDAAWIHGDSLRNTGQAWFEQWMSPNWASLSFGLCGLTFLFLVLLVCHRRRWVLKL
jgi:predicted acyltransferase